ncbi:hypothetical protein HK100_001001 [Physocladia obscura]|uniref:Protein kinase domain-containing protein n=1 Tax=Physocladia obscura TaxID=109957 RepID=A0AAD5T3I7_9FUNG|nr:hypothetical protein HK100_001001 [Physocladia obscura]
MSSTNNKIFSSSSSKYASSRANSTSQMNAKPAEVILSSSLAAIKVPPKKHLYAGLNSDDKARVSVSQAFMHSPEQFLYKYRIQRIIGFGSNGVVIAATASDNGSAVAIKIIYKPRVSTKVSPNPLEIEVLKSLDDPILLKYVESWQDENHFYLVTELFGSDWLSSEPAENLPPIVFNVRFGGLSSRISLPFSAGSSDLWAWAYAHRIHIWEVSHHEHTMLPIRVIKKIVKQVALSLAVIHSRGFYHGDIKLENILVQSGGLSDPEIRLADFGHSKHVSYGIDSYGTQEMSPPEFLRGSPYGGANRDGRASDIFALGMLMIMLLNEKNQLPKAAEKIASGSIGYEQLAAVNSGFYPLDPLEDISFEGLLLLNGMCMVDPARRITAEQLLSGQSSSGIIMFGLFTHILNAQYVIFFWSRDRTSGSDNSKLKNTITNVEKIEFAARLHVVTGVGDYKEKLDLIYA